MQCFNKTNMSDAKVVNMEEPAYKYRSDKVTLTGQVSVRDYFRGDVTTGQSEDLHEYIGDREPYVVVAVTLIGLVILIACSGNLMVLLAIRKVKKLQTVSNAFVFNLSLCDMLSAGCVLPFNIYTYVMDGWFVSDAMCNFVGFLGYTLTGTTIITITLIAFNRYKLVLDIGAYKQLYTERNIVIMIVLAWIIPILCLIPAVIGVWGKFRYVPMMVTCNLTLDHKSQLFKIFLMVFRAGIPCGLIIYFYARIYFATTRSHRRLSLSSRSLSAMDMHNQKKEMHMTRMMLIIFLVFVLSYFPCTITGMIDWTFILSKKYHMFCQISIYIASGANPLVYGLMNSQFRQAYKEIICCLSPRKNKYMRTTTNMTKDLKSSDLNRAFSKSSVRTTRKSNQSLRTLDSECCHDNNTKPLIESYKKGRPTFTIG